MPLEPEFGQIAIVIPASILFADTGVNGIEHCLLRIGGLDVLVLQVVKRDFGDLGNIAVMGRVETVELGDRELGTSHATRVFRCFHTEHDRPIPVAVKRGAQLAIGERSLIKGEPGGVKLSRYMQGGSPEPYRHRDCLALVSKEPAPENASP
jgi:hypothetical protein